LTGKRPAWLPRLDRAGRTATFFLLVLENPAIICGRLTAARRKQKHSLFVRTTAFVIVERKYSLRLAGVHKVALATSTGDPYALSQRGKPMSLALIEAEIRRFLNSSTPEVLCIKGKWGVGKTYGWRKFLEDAKRTEALALSRYSYVSLFGLNSLEDLRFAVFESTVSGENVGASPDDTTFSRLVGKGSDFARRMRPTTEVLSAMFNRKEVGDVLFKSAFLTVRRQLVCLDDLERAGVGLNARDVLGLASLLKEDRSCKVVLLLNDKEHDQKDEFDRQIEKVADVTLVFDLTSQEAVSIALTGTERTTTLLKQRIIELGITNIRVIKKIERLTTRLVRILDGVDDSVVEKAVATLTLASWSVQQPGEAPPIDFLRTYNRIAAAMRAGRENVNTDAERFRAMIQDYPFRGPESLDHLIFDGAIAGFFCSDAVRQAAEELQQKWRYHSRDSAFERAWGELYHGSLATEDDVFLDALFESSQTEAAVITPLNINGAVRMLREYGRGEQADEVIANYIATHEADGPNFFEIRRHSFSAEDRLDQGLRDAFTAKRAEFLDTRDPLAVLTSIGENSSWTDADLAMMARQSADDFERMFEALRGQVLRPVVEMVVAMGRGHHQYAVAIREASRAAFRRIADKSPIRARKIAG